MAKVRVPNDLLAGYAWMLDTVLGLEDQSTPTINRPDYGNDEHALLKAVPGWEIPDFSGKLETEIGLPLPKPVAEVRADTTVVVGAVRWKKGTSDKALVLPPEILPIEEHEFFMLREDGTPIIVRVTPNGFVNIPKGSTSLVLLNLHYPTARDGG